MTTVCNSRVLMIASLLEDALKIKETLNPKAPGRVQFCQIALGCFPELAHLKTKTPYTCARKLLMLYVSTKEDAELTFPIFKLLLPHMFDQASTFKTRCIHFCELRKSFKNKHKEVAECADEIFRLTRKDGLEHKEKYVQKPRIVLNVSLNEYIGSICKEMRHELADSLLACLVFASGCKIGDLIESEFEATGDGYSVRKTQSNEEFSLIGIKAKTFFELLALAKKEVETECSNKPRLRVLNKYNNLTMARIRFHHPGLRKSAGVKKIQLLHSRLLVEYQFLQKAESVLCNVDLQKQISSLREVISNLKRKYDTDEYDDVSTKRQCV
jgi:hypothetical protein